MGNTAPTPWASRPQTVHPHARGEHRLISPRATPSSGSSPRPWGTLRPRGPAQRAGRFIPTPVGNTSFKATAAALLTVHPHARGEHRRGFLGHQGKRGSSPRPWGTRHGARSALLGCRFIPTPVGNTTGRTAAPLRHSVHPHARGEHFEYLWRAYGPNGSSPRPWGTLSNLA